MSLCIMVLPGPAAAGPSVVQGVYVGDDYYHTIQDAIDAGSGKVLRILPGAYDESLSIDNKTSVTMDVYNPGDEVIINVGTKEPAISITGASKDIIINNLVIKGSGEGCGIHVNSSADGISVTMNNNTISGCSEGIHILAGSIVLEGNTLQRNAEAVCVIESDTAIPTVELNNNTFEYNGIPVHYENPEGQSLRMADTDLENNEMIGRVDIVPEGQSAVWGITQSIQEAVNYAPDGSTLNIYAGEYEEQVIVKDKALNLIGKDGRDCTSIITPEDKKSAALGGMNAMYSAPLAQFDLYGWQGVEQLQVRDLLAGAASQPAKKAFALAEGSSDETEISDTLDMALIIMNYASKKPVTIEGLTVTGLAIHGADGSVVRDSCFKDSQLAGVYLDSVDAVWNEDGTSIIKPVLICNNIFTQNLIGLAIDNNIDGEDIPYQESSDYVTVEKNEFTQNVIGLMAVDAKGLILAENDFLENLYGALLEDVYGQEASIEGSIKENKFNDNDLAGLWLQYYDNLSVMGNEINGNNYYGLILTGCADLLVTDNEINGNSYDGIFANKVNGCIFSDNDIKGNGRNGISMGNSNTCQIAVNDISGNGIGIPDEELNNPDNIYCGLFMMGSDYNKISGNTINDNKNVGLFLTDCEENLIKNNNIQNNGHLPEEDDKFGASYGGVLVDSSFYVVNSICFNNITGNEPNGVVVLDLLLNSGAISKDTAPANTSAVAPEKVPYTSSEMSYYGFQYNWWGDKSGPTDENQGYLFSDQPGNLLGTGQKVVGFWIDDYAPWLSAPFDTAYPGPEPVSPLPLASGWSLISTPYTLGLYSWNDIINLGDKLDASVIVRYNSTTKSWEECGKPGTAFDPQDAYFIKMNSNDLLPLVRSSNLTAPPVRTLEQGWNLASLAADIPMTVREALATAEWTADGRQGWVQVVKPPFKSHLFLDQDAWVYTVNSPDKKLMNPVAGYWIYMDNADELAGFTTTGPLQGPDWEQYRIFSQQVLTKETQQ
jgi:parallel beta-helix repeat protein